MLHLRDFLRDAGYNMQTLVEVFGPSDDPQAHTLKLAMVEDTLEPSRLNCLIRWFWAGSPVEATTARDFIPEDILDLFLKSGMVTEQDGRYAPAMRISLFNRLLILSDHASAGAERQGNIVMWPNPTTQACYHLAMQTPVDRTLDLGTGTGVLALEAASHSGSVVATDLNPRARQFCKLNAALNGITNVEFREGSGFEPVRGERFDLILVNPPFFVTPSVRHVYSDNNMELDGFCRMLVRQAPEHLTEGGYCQMLVEWVALKGQPWRERLGEWFAGTGCDVWVMVSYVRSSIDYALLRIQEDLAKLTDAENQTALMRRWREYFDSRQVEAIYGGMIVLRRREGPNWVRMEELQSTPSRPYGDFLRRIFDSRDYMSSHADDALLAARPLLAPSARLHKQFAASPEGWRLASVNLQVAEGLLYSLALQPQVADFLVLCDGNRTLGEISDRIAAAMSVDAAMVRKENCGLIRKVADRGIVLIR